MTHFSYNDSDLSTDLNKVRRLIGDVNSTGVIFSDEEIEFFIDEESNIYGAAATAKKSWAATVATQVSKTVGKLKIELQQKHENLLKDAELLTSKAKTKGGIQLYAGGLSISGKDSENSDTDRVQPDFYRDMMDFPGTETNQGGST